MLTRKPLYMVRNTIAILIIIGKRINYFFIKSDKKTSAYLIIVETRKRVLADGNIFKNAFWQLS